MFLQGYSVTSASAWSSKLPLLHQSGYGRKIFSYNSQLLSSSKPSIACRSPSLRHMWDTTTTGHSLAYAGMQPTRHIWELSPMSRHPAISPTCLAAVLFGLSYVHRLHIVRTTA